MLRRLSLSIVLSGFFCLQAAFATVALPPIFSDHMVLQKLNKIPIWGTAAAGEHITVTLDGIKGETDAGADSKWHLTLNLQTRGPVRLV